MLDASSCFPHERVHCDAAESRAAADDAQPRWSGRTGSDRGSAMVSGARAPLNASLPCNTPWEVTVIAVIFEVWPTEGRANEYFDLAASLKADLERIDGFI